MIFHKFFTDILFFTFTFCFSLHFSSLARSFTRYGFTFCAVLTHLTCFDFFTIVLKSSHLIILMIISPPIQSLLITLHYTTIGFHVRCFAYVFEVLRSSYYYPLSLIWYIEGLINSGRFELFSLQMRADVDLNIFLYIFIFFRSTMYVYFWKSCKCNCSLLLMICYGSNESGILKFMWGM